jgi:hypothetical protein
VGIAMVVNENDRDPSAMSQCDESTAFHVKKKLSMRFIL